MQRGQGERRKEGSLIPLLAACLTTQQAEGQECPLWVIVRDVTYEESIGYTRTQIRGQIFNKGTLLSVFSFCHNYFKRERNGQYVIVGGTHFLLCVHQNYNHLKSNHA